MPSKRSGAKRPAKLESREDLRPTETQRKKEGLAPARPRITDPWRAKLLKRTAHALMQLELRGEGVVALCFCGWQSKPTTTERRAHNAFARHKAAPNA